MTVIDRDRARAAFKSYTDAYDATSPFMLKEAVRMAEEEGKATVFGYTKGFVAEGKILEDKSLFKKEIREDKED